MNRPLRLILALVLAGAGAPAVAWEPVDHPRSEDARANGSLCAGGDAADDLGGDPQDATDDNPQEREERGKDDGKEGDKESGKKDEKKGEKKDEKQGEKQGEESRRPGNRHDSGVQERVVVSASATGETVRDAPAAVDVISGEELTVRPGDHLVDQLRRVPGINVVQFSARDVNIASRSATGGINNSTLALADGRSLYQDFLGFVMWEFAPTDPELIDRVEVVRGPASSLWGANAVGGVVHVVTRSPRDTPGGAASISAGSYHNRRAEARQSLVAGPWSLRVSGSYYEGDPFDRPSGNTNLLGEPIPDVGDLVGDIRDGSDVRDSGTRQPRFDLRADRVSVEGNEWILQAGSGQTRGWIATGLGPFDINPATSSSYVQARYRHGLHEFQANINHFDGDAINLVNAIPFDFRSTTAHLSARGRAILGRRGVAGWGVELNRSDYNLSIAPAGDRRTIAGLFGEIDLALVPRLRLVVGARVDHFEETIGTVFSPRVALRFKPAALHTLRIAAGRAFRAPSVVETDLLVPAIPVAVLDWQEIDEQQVGFPFFAALAEVVCQAQPDNCGAPPGEIPDYVAVTAGTGSRDLEEERTDSIEIGYAGRIERFDLAVTVYHTWSEGGIDFPQVSSYGFGPDGQPGTADDIVFPTDPDGDGIDEAPAVDVCPFVDALPPFRDLCPNQPVPYNQFLSIMLDGLVPSEFQWANGADTEDQGIEFSLNWSGPRGLGAWFNYSWQDEPKSDGVPMSERIDNYIAEIDSGTDLDVDGVIGDVSEFVNIPAEHRVALGVQFERPRWFGSVTYDYVSRTFWQDVLTSDFWGHVPSYQLVGLRAGVRWPAQGLELTGQVTNALDDEIQQHILGDVIARRASLELGYRWGGGGAESRPAPPLPSPAAPAPGGGN